jgi:hypothetical protein
VSITARALGKAPDDLRTLCNFSVTLHYEGAAATVVFNESGGARFPRERLTALSRGQVGILDDFAKLSVFGQREQQQGSGLRKSMGHAEELEEFVRAIKGEPNHLLSWEDAALATTCMFAAQESIRVGAEIDVAAFRRSLTEEPSNPDSPGSRIGEGNDEPDGTYTDERVPLG